MYRVWFYILISRETRGLPLLSLLESENTTTRKTKRKGGSKTETIRGVEARVERGGKRERFEVVCRISIV